MVRTKNMLLFLTANTNLIILKENENNNSGYLKTLSEANVS